MKLKEFIRDLTEEMEGNKWQNKTIEFDTIDRGGLSFLSVYKEGKKIHIDIGTDADSEEHNKTIKFVTTRQYRLG